MKKKWRNNVEKWYGEKMQKEKIALSARAKMQAQSSSVVGI